MRRRSDASREDDGARYAGSGWAVYVHEDDGVGVVTVVTGTPPCERVTSDIGTPAGARRAARRIARALGDAQGE